MPNKQLKQKLQRGEIVFGPFMNSSYPAFIEICGYTGFDFAIIDLEHGALNTLVAEDLCRAADCVNISPIIRVSKNDPSQIQRALDIGSAGVQVPQIESKFDAENVVKSAKYYPLGNRGLSFATRAGNYTASGADITTKLNQDSLVIIHLEGQKGIENLPEIVKVPDIDVIFLGPYDLPQSLGIPGKVNDQPVIDLMKSAVNNIRNHGKIAGTFADNPTMAKQWINTGCQYIGLSVDVAIFYRACSNLVQEMR